VLERTITLQTRIFTFFYVSLLFGSFQNKDFLKVSGPALKRLSTSESVFSKDFVKAEELLDNAIKKLLGTDPIAVGVDGTSMCHKKVQIVILHTLQ
jgi:hypothetical protein